MKYFIKRFWIILALAILINIPILVMGVTRTNQSVTLKGDTTVVEQFVEIDHPYEANGSFSTIYVISVDHSTILQNIFAGASQTSEVEELPDHYLHFTTSELNKMARIQHESSIQYSLLLAYQEASKIDESIHLESEFDAFVVSYYAEDSLFRIGDRIIGVNEIYAKDDFEAFRTAFNTRKEGDIFQVLRSNQEITIPYSESNMKISGYSFYTLNQATATPAYKIKSTNVGGSSGGLLQTLALYNSLIEEDITKGLKIAGTGTISPDGTVGPIGGIQQKIYTAFDDKMDVFLCPEDNYEDALIAYNKLKNKERMKLFKISSFSQALEVLKNV